MDNSNLAWTAPDTVAVVGDGFSGVATALHLMRLMEPGGRVALLGRGPRPGRGLAYATACDEHLLNVPAGRLGWNPADEGDFARWMAAQGLPWGPGDFAPRRVMGDYLEALWSEGVVAARARGIEVLEGLPGVRALRRAGTGWQLWLDDGRQAPAAQVVLATGHQPPRGPALGPGGDWRAPGFHADPWDRAPGTPLSVAPQDEVVLVGSGLTAVDLVLELRAQGHRGRIHLVSRRGLLPQPHRTREALPHPGLQPVAALGADLNLRQILRAVRRWMAAARLEGRDWRDVMASLRPVTPRLWQQLSLRERRQFLRHLQPWWDTHRHRMAPAVWQRLQAERATGDLQLHAGRLAGVASDRTAAGRPAWQLTLRPRGGDAATPLQTLRADAVFNCTGPSGTLAGTRDVLLLSLRDEGLLTEDVLGLGAQVDPSHHPLDGQGRPVAGLYVVGPLLKGRDWESIAIPELRQQALLTARAVLAADRPLRLEVPCVLPGAVGRAAA